MLRPARAVEYRYYRSWYWCMSDWLQSQRTCSAEIVYTMTKTLDLIVAPFTSRYDCPIVSNASMCDRIIMR